MSTKHVSLRLEPEMHSRLVAAADRSHRSLNGQIEWYIERGLADDREAQIPARNREETGESS